MATKSTLCRADEAFAGRRRWKCHLKQQTAQGIWRSQKRLGRLGSVRGLRHKAPPWLELSGGSSASPRGKEMTAPAGLLNHPRGLRSFVTSHFPPYPDTCSACRCTDKSRLSASFARGGSDVPGAWATVPSRPSATEKGCSTQTTPIVWAAAGSSSHMF